MKTINFFISLLMTTTSYDACFFQAWETITNLMVFSNFNMD